jgi:exodeoxyribonuclease VII small subunit
MSGEEEKFEQLSMFGQSPQTAPSTTGNIKAKKEKSVPLKSKSPTVESPNKPKEKSHMQAVDKGIDFEASLTQLETVVKELDGEVKLEQALKLFEEGIKLSVECEKFIKSAEQRIEILKKQADGSTEAESFETETAKLLAEE